MFLLSWPLSCVNFKKKDEDYSGVVDVMNATWPDYPLTIDKLKYADKHRDQKLMFGRIVVEVDDQIAASGVFEQWHGPPTAGKFFFNAAVHPDYRRRGLGTAIYCHAVDVLSSQRLTLMNARTREDQPGGANFLNQLGFEIAMRNPIMRLNVQIFDSERFPTQKEDRATSAVDITTLGDLMPHTANWKRKCWELDCEIAQDVPFFDEHIRPTFERYSLHYEHPTFTRHSWFIAVDGEEWIGLSTLWTDPATPGVYYTGVTGVRRAYRRQGIATSLKLLGIEYVRNRGAHTIETNNEENNPMRRLNEALGFEQAPAWINHRKAF